jgi:hypothetical protein
MTTPTDDDFDDMFNEYERLNDELMDRGGVHEGEREPDRCPPQSIIYPITLHFISEGSELRGGIVLRIRHNWILHCPEVIAAD